MYTSRGNRCIPIPPPDDSLRFHREHKVCTPTARRCASDFANSRSRAFSDPEKDFISRLDPGVNASKDGNLDSLTTVVKLAWAPLYHRCHRGTSC